MAAGMARYPAARLAYVTPSHQYPLGVTMSLARRLALLRWAPARMWVVEDDYDSEYRYTGRPLAALQGLDDAGRVLYIGTFSKVLSPALRLGYLVAPPDLVDAFAHARTLADRGSPPLGQATLAAFLTEGHAGRHIRRMRALYAERQAILVDAARAAVDTGCSNVSPSAAGMHLVGRLDPAMDDRAVTAHLARHGIETRSLSAHALQVAPRPGILLGYTAWDAEEICDGCNGWREHCNPHPNCASTQSVTRRGQDDPASWCGIERGGPGDRLAQDRASLPGSAPPSIPRRRGPAHPTTRMRIPRMHGRPPHCCGLWVIRARQIRTSLLLRWLAEPPLEYTL